MNAQCRCHNRTTRHQCLANTYVCCFLIVVVVWYVSRQPKVSYLEHVVFDNQHVTSGQVSVDTLRQRHATFKVEVSCKVKCSQYRGSYKDYKYKRIHCITKAYRHFFL